MLFLAIAAALGATTVVSDTDCPSAADVVAAISQLAPQPPATVEQRVDLRIDRGALVLTIRPSAGRSVTRSLDGIADCAERARAAAVVIATNQLELSHREPLALVPLPPPIMSIPANELTRQVSPVGRLAFDVTAALVSSFTLTGDYAPGASVAVALGRSSVAFSGRIVFLGEAERSVALGSGQVSWTRVAVSVGARYRWMRGRGFVDVDADFLAAALLARGVGLVDNHTAVNFDPGLSAGIRAGVRWRWLAPFLGLDVIGWLRREEVGATGLSATATLPQLEFALVAGASMGNFP